MKFSEFYIGMPVYLKESQDTLGVIIRYTGRDNDDFWVVVNLGAYEEEFILSDLGKFNTEKAE